MAPPGPITRRPQEVGHARNDEERRIRRLRHAALKQGLRLRKIPERSSMYWQYGPHMLGDAHRDRMVGVEHERRR